MGSVEREFAHAAEFDARYLLLNFIANHQHQPSRYLFQCDFLTPHSWYLYIATSLTQILNVTFNQYETILTSESSVLRLATLTGKLMPMPIDKNNKIAFEVLFQ